MEKKIDTINANDIDFKNYKIVCPGIEVSTNLPFTIIFSFESKYFYLYGAYPLNNDKTLECLVLSDSDYTECVLYVSHFTNNPSTAEICLFVKSLASSGLKINEISNKLPESFNVKSSVKLVEDLIKISYFCDELLILIHQKKLSIKDCLIFNFFTFNEQIMLCDFFLTINASSSDIRIIPELILEIKQGKNIDFKELLKVQKSDTSKSIIERLMILRYPHYSKMLNDFNLLIKALSLSENTAIHSTPFFEDSKLKLNLSFKNIDMLGEFIQKLNKGINDGIFEKIFNLLNENQLS